MNNFKKGSGNLDFGDNSSGDGDDQQPADEPETNENPQTTAAPATPEAASNPRETSTQNPDPKQQYPYFVRRNNVLDERDTRYELHIRDAVADQESQFRNSLADALGVGEISKTDAREFALLYAFENPEEVAELMRDEGINALD